MREFIIGLWSTLLWRGGLSVAFGICAFVWPGNFMEVLVVVFGFYLLIDGIMAVWGAYMDKGEDGSRIVPMAVGLVTIGIGVLALVAPSTIIRSCAVDRYLEHLLGHPANSHFVRPARGVARQWLAGFCRRNLDPLRHRHRLLLVGGCRHPCVAYRHRRNRYRVDFALARLQATRRGQANNQQGLTPQTTPPAHETTR